MDALTALLVDRKQIDPFVGHPTQNSRRYVYQFSAIRTNQGWSDMEAMSKLLNQFFAQPRRIQWAEYLTELAPGAVVDIHTLFTFMILRCGPSNPLEHYQQQLNSCKIPATMTLLDHLHEYCLRWDDYYDTLDCKELIGPFFKHTNEHVFFVERFISTLSNGQQILDLRQASARKEIIDRSSLRAYIAARTYLHTLHQSQSTGLPSTVHHTPTYAPQSNDLTPPAITTSNVPSFNPIDIATTIGKTLEQKFDKIESKFDNNFKHWNVNSTQTLAISSLRCIATSPEWTNKSDTCNMTRIVYTCTSTTPHRRQLRPLLRPDLGHVEITF